MIRNLIRSIVYSNIWVAIAAVSLAVESSYLYNHLSIPYLVFVFCGTILLYIGHRWIGIRKANIEPIPARLKYLPEHKTQVLFLTGISVLGCLVALRWMELDYILGLLISAFILGILYILPIFKDGLRFRDFPFIKIFIIAITWTILTALIPLRMHEESLFGIHLFSWIEKFFFVFMVTLPFDFRDVEVDKKIGLKTLANTLSVNQYKKLTLVVGLVGMICAFKYSLEIENIILLLAFFCVYVVTIVLVVSSYRKRSEMYYSGIIEGTIILRSIMILFFFIASND